VLPQVRKNVPTYNLVLEDRLWESSSLVATMVNREHVLHLQQRVEDAGFPDIIVTPKGRDCVLLHCSGKADMLQVFNDAVDYFGMLFRMCTCRRRRMCYTNVVHCFACMVPYLMHRMRIQAFLMITVMWRSSSTTYGNNGHQDHNLIFLLMRV
jgi:hypothetical protein